MKIFLKVCLTFLLITSSYGYTSFSIGQYPGIQWNAVGLAVDPITGNIFLASNSYKGEHNFYQFNPQGQLITSTRVPMNLGSGGNLVSMVAANNGHVYTGAVYFDFNPAHTKYNILELSQDGRTIFSSLPDIDVDSGLCYDPNTNNLFYLELLSPDNTFQIKEITMDGTVVNQFPLQKPFYGFTYLGMTFDPVSESFYVGEFNESILSKFSKDTWGQYVYVRTYDLKSIPRIKTVLAMDMNRSNGMFYVQSNNTYVVGFALNEVRSFYAPEAEPLRVCVDIKPETYPNPINVKSKGLLQVAVLGSKYFDVTTIDVLSTQLTGVSPVRSRYKDIARPLANSDACKDSVGVPDGYSDLLLTFDSQSIAAAIGQVKNGDQFILTLTGLLNDDTPIAGEDCVIICGKNSKKIKVLPRKSEFK